MENSVYQKNKLRDFGFLALDIWNGVTSQVRQFVNVTQVSYPVLQQAGRDALPFGHGTETLFVVDKRGIVRGIYAGLEEERINDMIDLVLADNPRVSYGPTQLYFGLTLKVGDERRITMRIQNDGTVDLDVSDIKASNPDITVDTTALTVPASGEQSIVVTYRPSTVGTAAGNLSFRTNDPDNRVVTIDMNSVTIEPGAPPVIALTEFSVTLGEFEVGTTGRATVTVRNDGQGPLQLTGFASDIPGLSADVDGVTVAAGGSVEIPVTVPASTEGAIGGTLSILSNDPANARIDIGVSGSAIVILGDPRMDYDGSGRVDFGDFVQFAGAFGSTNAAYDLDGDGQVAFQDFVMFATSFGRPVQ